jgi:hypothetical protein
MPTRIKAPIGRKMQEFDRCFDVINLANLCCEVDSISLAKHSSRAHVLRSGEVSVELLDLVVEETAACLFCVHHSAMTSAEICA